MKLLRYGQPGHERPGILDENGRIRDLTGVIQDLTSEALQPPSLRQLQNIDPNSLPLIEGSPRLGPCVGGVGKFICVGLNYADHAAEAGAAVPSEPIIFMKATSAICGPNDDVIIPRGSVKSDWEVELGVVIGKPAKYVSESEALSHVPGYCVVNDLSERAFHLEGTGQWVKGKSADTFGPIGPWLVTADEVPDPQNLEMWLEVDGRQISAWFDANDDLWRGLSCQLSQPLHESAARRYHFDRNTAGSWHGSEAAGISPARKPYFARDSGTRRSTSAGVRR
jgi:2-keto-4-pentenoate hydratase/2-oxohepta-3-ene-1,7-dioic acid hydratase in catechol pathway